MYVEESILHDIMREESELNSLYLKRHPQSKDGTIYLQMNDIFNELIEVLSTLAKRVNLKFYYYKYNVEGLWHVDFSFYGENNKNSKYNYMVRDLVNEEDVRKLALKIINRAMEDVNDVKGC